jgi:Protein of unknown function (DUF3238)
MPTTINSIKFWINAFIPKMITNYTKNVPNHTSLTMIPGPAPLSDCFHTDQRGFSSDIHASSRMHSEVTVNFSASGVTITTWHNCDETVECDCEDGGEECRKKGTTAKMLIKLTSSTLNEAVLSMKCAANNPCSTSSSVIGDIDYEGTIVVNKTTRKISCDLKIDAFPAFESYATINNGAGIKLFQISPPLGNTVMNLPGTAKRVVKCTLEDINGDGVFEKLTQSEIPK